MSGQAARAEKRRRRRVELRVGAIASRASEMQECCGFDLEAYWRIIRLRFIDRTRRVHRSRSKRPNRRLCQSMARTSKCRQGRYW